MTLTLNRSENNKMNASAIAESAHPAIALPTMQASRMHAGMPPLDEQGAPLSFFEFWPARYFYIPIALQWLWLMLRYRGLTLPTVTNPLFPFGGLTGESKRAILSQITAEPGKSLFAQHASLAKVPGVPLSALVKQAREAIRRAGFDFPFVAKPDVGCRGVGVQLLRDYRDLARYIAAFPVDARILFQEYIDHEAEAGVFYIREPGTARGRLFSMTLKYFPHVIGDGVSSLRELIVREPRAGRIAHIYLPRHAQRLDWVPAKGEVFRLAFTGSHSRGSIFRDGRPYITPALTEAFDRIADTIPEFHFGRFDVRFTTIEALQRGEGFRLIEVNGAGGEATHIWDRRIGLLDAYRALFAQNAAMFKIGALNRERGFRPVSLKNLWRAYNLEKQLTRRYPLTH
jgi:hypothetical protein